MPTVTPVPDDADGLRAGLRVSLFSLVWTVAAGGGAVAAGLVGGSLALAAFGAVGLLDGVGSASLVLHFRHGLRHEALSERRERITLGLVRIGLSVVGLATIVLCVVRLAARSAGHTPLVGVVLSGVSMLVLVALAMRKYRIARIIPSPALHADGWLSATGSALAFITVVGTALAVIAGWWWVDSAAAIGVGCGALALGIMLGREERGQASAGS